MKIYAVRQGRNPGIYETWTECQEQTHGYSGAVFKSFETMEEAQEFLHQDDQETVPIKEGLPFAYIDGSFSKKNGCYGYGGFIFTGTEYHILQGTGDKPDYMQERNIAGELLGTLETMYKCKELNIDEINLFYDYTGIREYTTGNWKAKTPLTMVYTTCMELVKNYINVHFVHVHGHTGNEGNELADYLAKEAVGAQLRKKDIKALQEFRDKAQEGRATT